MIDLSRNPEKMSKRELRNEVVETRRAIAEALSWVGRHDESDERRLKRDYDKTVEALHTVYPAPADEEEDPTAWCHVCGAMEKAKCTCGPIAENE